MSKWAEIRIDFYDDNEEKWCVDAWKTDIDDEEGTVIAKIDNDGNVEYLDEDARYDEYVQDCIKEFKSEKEQGNYYDGDGKRNRQEDRRT